MTLSFTLLVPIGGVGGQSVQQFVVDDEVVRFSSSEAMMTPDSLFWVTALGVDEGNRDTQTFRVDCRAHKTPKVLPYDSTSFEYYETELWLFVDHLPKTNGPWVPSFQLRGDGKDLQWFATMLRYFNDDKDVPGIVLPFPDATLLTSVLIPNLQSGKTLRFFYDRAEDGETQIITWKANTSSLVTQLERLRIRCEHAFGR